MSEEIEVVPLGLAVAVRVEVGRDLAAVGVEVGRRLVVVQLRVAGLEDRGELVGGDAEPDRDEGVEFDEGGTAFVLGAERGGVLPGWFEAGGERLQVGSSRGTCASVKLLDLQLLESGREPQRRDTRRRRFRRTARGADRAGVAASG
ncbi:hypothetical protein ACWDQL_13550 [Streptomyces olivaceus]